MKHMPFLNVKFCYEYCCCLRMAFLRSSILFQSALKYTKHQTINFIQRSVAFSSSSIHTNNREYGKTTPIGCKFVSLKTYYDEGDLNNFELQIRQLEEQHVEIAGVIYARWVDLKANTMDLFGALELFRKYKLQNDQFYLFPQTVVQIVALFVDVNQLDEALKFIAETRRSIKLPNGGFNEAQFSATTLLNRLADQGKVHEIHHIFQGLIDNGHVVISNKLLGPLIRVHIVNDNVSKAVEIFENITKQYNHAPMKGFLFSVLIQRGDLTTLEKVVDISSTVHCRHRVLTDLAFCFLEQQEFDQAQNIFNIPNLKPTDESIKRFCEKSKMENKKQVLEDLIKVTHHLISVKQEIIFFNLLDFYIQENNSVKALETWVTLKERNELPNDEFRIKLGVFLKSMKIIPPFDVPRQVQSDTHDFIEILNEQNSTEIHKAYQLLSTSNLTAIIRKLDKTSRQLFKLYDALAEAGDIEGIENVNSLLPRKFQNRLWYRNSRAKAFGISDQANQWVAEWNEKVKTAFTAEELEDIRYFPCNGFYSLLTHNPELIDECEELARKCAEKNILGPINMVWCYQFINRRHESSNQLWNEFIRYIPNIQYVRITDKALIETDDGLVNDLIEQLKLTDNGKLHLNGAYGTLLSIYLRTNQLDEALRIIDILKTNGKTISRHVLNELKAAFKAADRKIPCEIEQAEY